jgi:hypothetical protein
MKVRERNIRVATVFEPGGKIKPVWFDWQRRKHTVIETTYSWEGKLGTARLLFFAVRAQEGMYELIYNTADQTWGMEWLETAP